MKVLLDHDLPKNLRLEFSGHLALTARQMGWEALSNGRLLAAAEEAAFDVLLTGDQSLHTQQNHASRRISLLLVTSTKLPELLNVVDRIREALRRAVPGSFEVIHVPLSPKVRKPPPGV